VSDFRGVCKEEGYLTDLRRIKRGKDLQTITPWKEEGGEWGEESCSNIRHKENRVACCFQRKKGKSKKKEDKHISFNLLKRKGKKSITLKGEKNVHEEKGWIWSGGGGRVPLYQRKEGKKRGACFEPYLKKNSWGIPVVSSGGEKEPMSNAREVRERALFKPATTGKNKN